MDGAAIPYDALIWDAPKGHANYLAQALQQPLLLSQDMDSIRHTKQPNLFISLKRDLAMVRCFSTIQVFKIIFFICYVNRIFNYTCHLQAGHSASLCGRGLGAECK